MTIQCRGCTRVDPPGHAHNCATCPVCGPADHAGVQVGDIFAEMWGYDQTNWDYWQVVRVTAKTVGVKHVATSIVEAGGPYGDKVTAVRDGFTWPEYGWQTERVGKPDRNGVVTKRVRYWQGKPSLSMTSYSSASLWDGEQDSQTDPMFGH